MLDVVSLELSWMQHLRRPSITNYSTFLVTCKKASSPVQPLPNGDLFPLNNIVLTFVSPRRPELASIGNIREAIPTVYAMAGAARMLFLDGELPDELPLDDLFKKNSSKTE